MVSLVASPDFGYVLSVENVNSSTTVSWFDNGIASC